MIARLAALFSRFFRWWFGELAACVPARLRCALRRARPALLLVPVGDSLGLRLQRGSSIEDLGTVDTGAGDARSAVTRALGKIRLARLDTVVLLPQSQVLARRLTLPLAAAENLREILGFELDRHAPFPAEQAAFDFRMVASDQENQELLVDLVVATKAAAEQAKAAAVALGLPVDRVDVAGSDGAAGGFDLLQRGSDARVGRNLHRVDLALGAAVCVLLVLALWLPLERKQRELMAYDALLAEMRPIAADVETLRGTIQAAVDRQRFVARHREAAPMAVAVLDEITKRLPDDSWLLELRLDRREVLLSGFAPAAAELIPLFEESPLFHEVRFAAPVTPDSLMNLERFNFALPLLQPAGAE